MRLLHRVLCALRQHRLEVEVISWEDEHYKGVPVAYLWHRQQRPSDSRGVARTRCMRPGCRLMYSPTFLATDESMALRERVAMMATRATTADGLMDLGD